MGCGDKCGIAHSENTLIPYSRLSTLDHLQQEISEQGLSLADVVETGKRPCCDHNNDRRNLNESEKSESNNRSRWAGILCILSALCFATLAGLFVPRLFLICPTIPLLSMLWLAASVPPSSAFVGAIILSAASGIAAGGLAKGLAMALCSSAGLTTILVAANQKTQRKVLTSHAWDVVAGILRWPCETVMQIFWMLPLTLTLPLRLPVALFLDFMAATSFAVGDLVLNFLEDYVGYTLAENVDDERGPSSGIPRTPIILIHGLNSSRAVWLIGLLFLRSRAKHLGPFVTLRLASSPRTI